jgi:hypothetical protein
LRLSVLWSGVVTSTAFIWSHPPSTRLTAKGVALAEQGRESEARATLVEVYRRDPNWAELLRRPPVIDPALDDPQLIERLAALPTPSD